MDNDRLPRVAKDIFADRMQLADRFAGHLATTGVEHGLVGPREIPRLWERHILNCAVVTDLIPLGATIADVGTGAGLPGVVIAIRRPDLRVILVEPLLRRVTWLQRVVSDLELDHVEIVRSKIQSYQDSQQLPFVTARAVAPLSRLATWCLPLLSPGGSLLAMKGRSAGDELTDALDHLPRGAIADSEIITLGQGTLGEATTVIRLVKGNLGFS